MFACESKMASILNLILGIPVDCQLFPFLEEVGCPLRCPLSCSLYLYMTVVDSLICMAIFPWVAHTTAD